MSTGNIWLTSDLHLGHEKVAALRGFESAAQHDVSIIETWGSQARSRDQVWVLGDLATSAPARALGLLRNYCAGEKHLIWGNHDQGHPMHRNAHRKAGQYLDVFASAAQSARRRINGQSVLLSHFPYVGDTAGRERDRHVEWRLQMADQVDEVQPIVHGHTHSTEKFSWAAEGVVFGWDDPQPEDIGKQIHVGWDAWRRLVHIDEIAELLA